MTISVSDGVVTSSALVRTMCEPLRV